jgi:type II secretory pathway predicted ATPase ExeA
MYEAFYGLKEKPFSIQPDPDFLYWGHAHSLAFAMLEYGVMNQAGFTVITGDIGCGKTTLVRELLRRLGPETTIGLLSNTRPEADNLLNWIMMSLGQPFEQPSYIATYQDFEKFLVDQYYAGRRTVLIIDEAHNLGARALEELRMLSNVNADKDQLLQLILIGQPQLRALLQQPDLVQLAQRVASDFHLGPLGLEEALQYINHRLVVAGCTSPLFSKKACEMIYEASYGVPRTINILCDTTLIYGFSVGAPTISSKIVGEVLDDKRKYGILASSMPPH